MRASILLLAPPALGLTLAAGLTFAPEEGSSTTKRFSEATIWSLDSISQTVDGEVLPVDEISGFDCDFERTLTFLDGFTRVREGEIRSLRREITEASISVDMEMASPLGSFPFELAAGTDLEGEVLVFDVDDEGDVSVALEDGEEPPALEGVWVDADLAGLLPREAAEVGSSWTIEDEALAALFMPGGDLDLMPDSAPEIPGGNMESSDLIASAQVALSFPWDVAAGGIEAEWTATVEADGRELARIALTAELELAADRTDLLDEMCEACGIDSAREDRTFEATWSLEGEGELLWDLEANQFASMELNLEGTALIELGWGEDIGGGMTIPVEIRADLSTETKLSAERE